MPYDVLVLRDGKWAIEGQAVSKAGAEQSAVAFLGKLGVDGVRVAKDTGASIANLKPDDILFERMRPAGRSDRIVIGEIDEAPPCEEPADLFGTQARLTINRLFRGYLDKNALTATEVMHSFKELKRALDHDTMVPGAIAKVAGLQAKGIEGASTNERRDALYDMIGQISERARHAQSVKLPRVRDGGYEAMFDAVMGNGKADGNYFFKVAVSRELIDIRNWWGKFAQTVDWAVPCGNPEAVQPLDSFMSDALTNAELLRDVLGEQADLAHALMTMVDLSGGALEEPADAASLKPEDQAYTTVQLNGLLGAGRLPDCQTVLMDRVRRQLESAVPLTKGDRDQEREAFRGLVDKLVPGLDVMGGPTIAEAMLQRQTRIINKGGVAGLKEAAASVLPSLQDPARKAGYLLSLQQSKLGQDVLAEEIDQLFDSLLVSPSSINSIVKDNLAPNRKMEKITSIFYAIRSSQMTEQRRMQLTERLDELLSQYIVNDKILEKIDNPNRPLHVRAFMLVSMCRPEMLPRGKASDIARKIIVKNLRRPDFETELVSQIDDASEKERVLRRFHEELVQCGFFG
jgi:hypothetical protein